jgi:hypothetical protein
MLLVISFWVATSCPIRTENLQVIDEEWIFKEKEGKRLCSL